ncbi:hemin-degrading factor [Pseudaquabacterium rugosum]|uniref:ChuX/HutX family heme-like substrate-binding protein n=1 Tax=Pseudaquabacterium rugosum TaxID=2984194 RepID=A0ABU9BE62_9BURK
MTLMASESSSGAASALTTDGDRTTDPRALRLAFAEARRAGRGRHRDIAERLGLSEAALVAAHCGAWPVVESPLRARRLQGPWPELVAAVESLGEVMALTRNDGCVHEKTGVYRRTSVNGTVGLVLGGAIDLRLFYRAWSAAWAVEELLADGQVQRSLQAFDAAGQAVHKIFLRPASDLTAWEPLIAAHLAADQRPGFEAEALPGPATDRPDAEIDVATFQAEWRALQDTHAFFGLLQRHGLGRVQALRLAPPGHSRRLATGAAHALLRAAADQGTGVMVFVGNPGVIQIHSGPVQRVERMGPWLNVLDPGFNLHLREDLIDQAWWVAKPTADGPVHSLELFDAAGQTLAMCFGVRKPGQVEDAAWAALLDSLPGLGEGGAPQPVPPGGDLSPTDAQRAAARAAPIRTETA